MARDSSFAGGCLGAMFGMGAVALVCALLCGGCVFIGGNAIQQTNKAIEQQQKSSKITMANFSRVKPGMTPDEVFDILGKANAEVAADSSIAGIRTQMVVWKTPYGPNCNVMFQNGRVVSKAQFGLR